MDTIIQILARELGRSEAHVENVVRLTGEKQGCGGFCKACFDGEYPTKIPSTESKNRFEKKISERESQ